MDALTLLQQSPVMPVIVIKQLEDAVELARALVAGGIRSLEVTLRSAVALEAISLIREQVPEAIVGVGTVRSPAQLEASLKAGAQFAISPGLPPELLKAAQECPVPFLPGVASPTEAMRAADAGFTVQKLFPAEAVGGRALLKALAGPLPELKFCPTGGISLSNAPDYLALPNVMCVGGSWLTPEDLVAARDWDAISELARAAATLGLVKR